MNVVDWATDVPDTVATLFSYKLRCYGTYKVTATGVEWILGSHAAKLMACDLAIVEILRKVSIVGFR